MKTITRISSYVAATGSVVCGAIMVWLWLTRDVVGVAEWAPVVVPGFVSSLALLFAARFVSRAMKHRSIGTAGTVLVSICMIGFSCLVGFGTMDYSLL